MDLSNMEICRKCDAVRPERAHHCSLCNKCYLRMDHHCPWVANCVGVNNYGYFWLFLLWACIGTVTMGCGMIPYLYKMFTTKGYVPPVSVLVSIPISIGLSLGTAFLLFVHTYLLVTNQTTIEFYQNRSDLNEAKKRGQTWTNPYDLGRKANFEEIMGPVHPLFAVFVPVPIRPLCDGFSYRRKTQPLTVPMGCDIFLEGTDVGGRGGESKRSPRVGGGESVSAIGRTDAVTQEMDMDMPSLPGTHSARGPYDYPSAGLADMSLPVVSGIPHIPQPERESYGARRARKDD
ncbi:hypothetical protein KIPB_004593, partial [Kipferlia bialata]|eukprot:g4593.t1